MKAIKQIIIIGVFYLLLVSTYISFSFIVTYMYQHKKDGFKYMGPLLLASNYFAFLIGNSFAPHLRISLKKMMAIASVTYSINYGFQSLMIPGGWGIIFSVLGSIIGGFGASLLWVAYGAYVKKTCKKSNEE